MSGVNRKSVRGAPSLFVLLVCVCARALWPLLMPLVQKKALEGINARLALVIKRGKYSLGLKQTIRNMRTGSAKMVILSENTPPLRRSQIEYYAMLGNVKVLHYAGSECVLPSPCLCSLDWQLW